MENTLSSAKPLTGKLALITGASRGIGRATAERLRRDGAAGLTETDMAAALPPERKLDAINHTALGRLGQPQEITDVVAFLAGPDARWVTGQTIYADGGFH